MQLLLEQPKRMLEEVRGLKVLAAESFWLTKLVWGFVEGKDVCADFDVTIGDKTYEAQLVFPGLFPQIPAYVRPRNQDETWSIHQYKGKGTLCLEWGPDNWHPGVTGVDLVNSTHKLLAHEILAPIIGETPSRHELTLGQRLRGKAQRFLATSELAAALKALDDQPCVPITVVTNTRFTEMVAYVAKLGDAAAKLLPGLPVELTDKASSLFVWDRAGWMVRCASFEGFPVGTSSQPALRKWLKAQNSWPWPDDQDQSGFLLLVDADGSLRPIGLYGGEGSTAFAYEVIDCNPDSERQPQTHQELAAKRVAIVGMGSVGSKIAISLARSGVRQFLLIDDDVLLPHNLVRNQLDWTSVGYGKVDGVKGAIQLVAPDASVDARTFKFAGQESAWYNTTVLEQIAACDMVVDATASSQVFSALAAICTRRGVALVWGEVFAGGIGGLMARSRPGKDADPLAVRTTINEYLSTLPEAPFVRALGYDVETQGEVLIAGDADVSLLAASMTLFAIDTLLTEEAPRFPVAAYLFGYKQAWTFTAPFDTHPISCPPAGPPMAESEDAEVNPAVLVELLGAFAEGKC